MEPGFAILSALTVMSAVAAMSLRNLVHCALSLIVTFAGLAALFLRLDAQFVGFAQVLVYIGAVAILILFAILLTRSSEMGQKESGARIISGSCWVGILVALVTFGSLALAVTSSKILKHADGQEVNLTVNSIGKELMDKYVLPLEVIGLLLTAAMIGAALIAMPEKDSR